MQSKSVYYLDLNVPFLSFYLNPDTNALCIDMLHVNCL